MCPSGWRDPGSPWQGVSLDQAHTVLDFCQRPPVKMGVLCPFDFLTPEVLSLIYLQQQMDGALEL